jgi:hypothetical protein
MIIAFHRFVKRLRKNNNYLLSPTGNTYQTPLNFDMPTSMTIKGKGEKSTINYPHNWMDKTALHCEANKSGWNKVAAICYI